MGRGISSRKVREVREVFRGASGATTKRGEAEVAKAEGRSPEGVPQAAAKLVYLTRG